MTDLFDPGSYIQVKKTDCPDLFNFLIDLLTNYNSFSYCTQSIITLLKLFYYYAHVPIVRSEQIFGKPSTHLPVCDGKRKKPVVVSASVVCFRIFYHLLHLLKTFLEGKSLTDSLCRTRSSSCEKDNLTQPIPTTIAGFVFLSHDGQDRGIDLLESAKLWLVCVHV